MKPGMLAVVTAPVRQIGAAFYVDVKWYEKTNEVIDGGWWAEVFEPAEARTLDPGQITHTRGGLPVRILPDKGPEDRPILAEVHFLEGSQVLSYQPDGHFYKHFDQDIDLVQRAMDAQPRP